MRFFLIRNFFIWQNIFYRELIVWIWLFFSKHSFWWYQYFFSHASTTIEIVDNHMNLNQNWKLIRTERWWKQNECVNALKCQTDKSKFLFFSKFWTISRIVGKGSFSVFLWRECCSFDVNEIKRNCFSRTKLIYVFDHSDIWK